MEPDESYKVDIYIELNNKTHKIKAILDTGASLSVINKKYIDKHKIETKATRRKFKVKTVNGGIIMDKLIKTKVIDQDYEGDEFKTEFYHEFYVLDDIPYDIIIGRPLMRMLRYRVIRLERRNFIINQVQVVF